MTISAKRVMSGTYGAVYVDGDKIAEISSFQAKYAVQREDIQIAGEMAVDSKPTSAKGTGSMTIRKVFSRFGYYVDQLLSGRDARMTIIGKLDDPDALGAERIVFFNVSLDELTLMDWAVGKTQDLTYPFRFTRAERLQEVEPQ